MKRLSIRRYFSFVFLVLVVLHLIGASSTFSAPGVVTWFLGPCAVNQSLQAHTVVFACYHHDLVRLWPLNDALAGPPAGIASATDVSLPLNAHTRP